MEVTDRRSNWQQEDLRATVGPQLQSQVLQLLGLLKLPQPGLALWLAW